jgi:hypothetical protein
LTLSDICGEMVSVTNVIGEEHWLRTLWAGLGEVRCRRLGWGPAVRYVTSYSEARAAIGVALWYPILVLSLAYDLFLGLLIEIVPRFIAAFEVLPMTATATNTGALAPR